MDYLYVQQGKLNIKLEDPYTIENINQNDSFEDIVNLEDGFLKYFTLD